MSHCNAGGVTGVVAEWIRTQSSVSGRSVRQGSFYVSGVVYACDCGKFIYTEVLPIESGIESGSSRGMWFTVHV